VEGFQPILREEDFNCAKSHSDSALSVKLQQTVEIRSGYRDNNGGSLWFRNNRGGVLQVPGVMHFGWHGLTMYIYRDLSTYQKNPTNDGPFNGPLTCAMFENIFNPGDTMFISTSSMKNSGQDALKLIFALFISSAEFHTSTMNVRSLVKRTEPPSIKTKNRKYKAIVVIFMGGGVDSWNFLVPISGCKHDGTNFDLFNEYKTIRGSAAITNTNDLHMITSPNTTPINQQPCSGFGVNKALDNIKNLYVNGDANFIVNVGSLIEPLTRDEYSKKSKRYPESLFAHNSQQRQSKNVHSGSKKPKGVLGRMVEALSSQENPYAAAGYSMNGIQNIFNGKYPPAIVGSDVETLLDDLDHTKFIRQLLDSKSINGFSETYNHLLNRSIVDTDKLFKILNDATSKPTKFSGNSRIEKQMKNVASVILARNGTKSEREVFYVEQHGFDSHFQNLVPGSTVYDQTQQFDSAIRQFELEMKQANLWDDVLIVSSSDFGRKLQGNNEGTDHGWGGHNFIAGGGVKGGQILGDYPSRLDETSTQNILNSGGRFVPTTSWEAVWKPIAEWFGVHDSKLQNVLPNLKNFPKTILKSEMFD
jgi:uncharacterized protein (DUF1501 family)